MKHTIRSATDCRCCVYGRGACALGLKRAWNGPCDEFRPYCLDCAFPDWLCHTCNNQRQKRFKPDRSVFRIAGEQAHDGRFRCVW
ncbi:MAG: hypothetical protein AB7D51_02195 [Desulfovibrionaceae bacterium]